MLQFSMPIIIKFSQIITTKMEFYPTTGQRDNRFYKYQKSDQIGIGFGVPFFLGHKRALNFC